MVAGIIKKLENYKVGAGLPTPLLNHFTKLFIG